MSVCPFSFAFLGADVVLWAHSSRGKIALLRFLGQLQLIHDLNSDLTQKGFDFAQINWETGEELIKWVYFEKVSLIQFCGA